MDLSKVTLWMKNYNMQDLLKWIQCTSIHPNNAIYQTRFEFLLACVLSINGDQFRGNTLSRDDFKKFIDKYYEDSSEEMAYLEDFEPFEQNKLIPYYYNGEEKFIFYGVLERPYEFTEKFEYLYVDS
jgi:hypothetical protein